MDAHLFRRLCDALSPRLIGARLQKIQAPAPDLLCLGFYARRHKFFLLLKHGRDPFICCTPRRPAAEAAPSSGVMHLRGHILGRYVRNCQMDAPERRLYLLFSSGTPAAAGKVSFSSIPDAPCASEGPAREFADEAANRAAPDARALWLCLDLRDGFRLLHCACPPPSAVLVLPAPEEAASPSVGPHAPPRTLSGLTPALRRTLALLEEAERRALLVDLASGGGDVFVYGEGGEAEIFAWPLPDALRRGRTERVFEDVVEASALVGTARIFTGLDAAERRAREMPLRRELRRLRRLALKLDAEEGRLRAMADGQKEALALQAELWRLPEDARPGELMLMGESGPLRIPLDPRRTPREHMERLFHAARRGRRGLLLLEQRRAETARKTAQAEEALRLGLPPAPAGYSGRRAFVPAAGRGAERPAPALPKKVQGFRNADGFVLLRGRDAEGNLALLRLARPDDLWLHAEGGPGAHVLIRCGRREIPERALHDAAQLAALKSPWRDSPRARILCARARHVRPVKGARPGTVRVEKQERTLDVPVDAETEARLEKIAP